MQWHLMACSLCGVSCEIYITTVEKIEELNPATHMLDLTRSKQQDSSEICGSREADMVVKHLSLDFFRLCGK